MSLIVGLHYFNIYDYISDLVLVYKIESTYIKHNGVYIGDMINNNKYELHILSNDYEFMKNFIQKNGSETEIMRFNEFMKSTNLKIIKININNNFIFGICNYCAENNLECAITKAKIHEHSLKLAKHCKEFIHRYNVPQIYDKVIVDMNIVLFYIMRPNNKTAEYLLDLILKNKNILIVKELVSKVEAYVYLKGTEEDIERMNDYFNSITIIDNVNKYIKENIGEKEINEKNIIDTYENYEYKYVANILISKDAVFNKSLNISNSLNIPFVISENKYFSFLSTYLKINSPLVICYNKIEFNFI